jgi:hypothetical protein
MSARMILTPIQSPRFISTETSHPSIFTFIHRLHLLILSPIYALFPSFSM